MTKLVEINHYTIPVANILWIGAIHYSGPCVQFQVALLGGKILEITRTTLTEALEYKKDLVAEIWGNATHE